MAANGETYTPAPITYTQCEAKLVPFDCATLSVPLDWNNPAGEPITVAVAKLKAAGTRRGTLFVNPGGPGMSARASLNYIASTLDTKIRSAFDLVAVDPRGTGGTLPVDCVGDQQLLEWAGADPTLADTAGDYSKADAQLVAGCQKALGGRLAYLTTADSARDMDAVRAASGLEQISYFGFSYGSELGARYAQLFPTRVRHAIFDGASDANLTPEGSALAQAEGFEHALDAYLADCTNRSTCPYQTDPDAEFDQFMRQLADQLLPVGDPSAPSVGVGIATVGVLSGLYDRNNGWGSVDNALSAAGAGDGSALWLMFASYVGKDPATGLFDNTLEAQRAIRGSEQPGLNVEQQQTLRAQLRLRAPRVAMAFQPDIAADTWPTPTRSAPAFTLIQAPMVAIGTTGDPATSYLQTAAMAQHIGAALVTLAGEGHTGYRQSECVKAAIDAFLLEDKTPVGGLKCNDAAAR